MPTASSPRWLSVIYTRLMALTTQQSIWLLLVCGTGGWGLFQCYRMVSATLEQARISHSLRRAESLGTEINGLPSQLSRHSRLQSTNGAPACSKGGLGVVLVTAAECGTCQQAESQWAAMIRKARQHIGHVMVVAVGSHDNEPANFIKDAGLADDARWEVRGVDDIGDMETATGISIVPTAIVFNCHEDALVVATGALVEADRRTAGAILLQDRTSPNGAIMLAGADAFQLAKASP
jgi:hypothetical protein